MKAVTLRNRQTNEVWTEILDLADGHKWIDAARPALELSVARQRIGDVDQPGLDISIRRATREEIAAKIDELRLARALRVSNPV